MIFCVSIGNTNIKCAVGTKESYRYAALPTAKIKCAEDFLNHVYESFQDCFWDTLEGSIISSVVPNINDFIADAVFKKSGSVPLKFDKSMSNLDISNYNSNLGEDRIICCAHALTKYNPPLVVVDFGTATTVNVICPDGTFIGGSIMVGVQTGLNALNRVTAQLPKIGDKDTPQVDVIGNDTMKCLISGAYVASAYAVGGYIKYVEKKLNAVPNVILTGGSAPLVMPHCDFQFTHEPMLLIDGLFHFYNKLSED